MKNRLKEVRESKGMTQEELSRKSGVARTVISYLETEKDMDVKLSTLTSIAKSVDDSVSNIFLV